jgi:Ribbon-helix-helix protein, copG family
MLSLSDGPGLLLSTEAPFMSPSTVKKEIARIDTDMTELSLLVPTWQLDQLERLARDEGLTLGQIIRRLINAFLKEP